ncbi:MAG: redoxin domain-containing protein [Robiginitomaculum sp.]|nr:redoxin domain-containing protein [Robiginitomaculum sp.]
MPEIFMVSQVLLWIAVMVLTTLVLAWAGQVGVLHERIAPAGALAMNAVLKVGEKAPHMIEQSLDGRRVEIGNEKQVSTLVFFLSPDCPVCKTLLPALKSALKAEKSWLECVLASDGSIPEIHKDFIKRYDLEAWPYVVSENLGKQFGVSKLPYAALVDEAGVVRSLGMVNSRAHLESLFVAKETGVASIQDYMAKRNRD